MWTEKIVSISRSVKATRRGFRRAVFFPVLAAVMLSPELARAQGPMTAGALHTGTITTGETDTWTFSANAGDRLMVTIGEVEPTSGFSPWVRLMSPTATLLSEGAGAMAAQAAAVVAPTTGTYTVLVASYFTVPSGTGGYQVTLLRVPGALTVSPGDQGGPVTNGASHTGEITLGDMDIWTFSANAGDDITASVGEVEPTNAFSPWIVLFGPTGATLGDGATSTAAQINNVSAPVTGTYVIIVLAYYTVPAGTGNYVLTVARTPGAITVSPGDQGGPMTNGAIHTGELTLGDLDLWSFSANAGDSLTVNIGEIEPTNALSPWIRLIGPTGALLGQGASSVATQINTIIAPQTGTYVVQVAPYFTVPGGTGNYVLTLGKVPGSFTVSPGDQGGPAVLATTNPGELTVGDLDMWSFLAGKGDALVISIGEIEPTSALSPWIRLIGPTGALVGQAAGAVAAQINVAAPMTGRYTVLVASYFTVPQGTGFYQLTVTGVTTPNPLTELAIDFGPTWGLWLHYNNGAQGFPVPSWQQLHGLSPTVMAKGRIDANTNEDLIVTFAGFGVWAWMNNTTWVQIHGFDATQIATADLDGNGVQDLVVSFPGYGVWARFDNGTWTQLHTLNALAIAVGRVDLVARDDLIIHLQGAGVWLFLNNATWSHLHPFSPTRIQVVNLDGNAQDDIALNFPGYGLYIRYNNSSWYHLHSFEPTGLAAGNLDDDAGNRQDLIINFPGFGVWAFMNNTTWVQLHGLNSPILAVHDVDFNGRDDVILNFPGFGIWLFMNNATYRNVHGLDPEAIVPGRFDVY
jgi:hypothetical protein